MKILVIGQGIAGTVLSWVLRRRGVDVTVADGGHDDAASKVAAGIVNPVTGKHYVKSWMIDQLLPAAKACYTELETALGMPVWLEQPMYRLLGSPLECNNWDARAGDEGYAAYMAADAADMPWLPYLHGHYTFGKVIGGGRVDFMALLPAYRKYARANGFLFSESLPMEGLPSGYDHYIFCEGFRGASNPFFKDLPWQLNKGEALIVRFPDLAPPYPEAMLKKTILLAHLGEGNYWAGAPYNPRYTNPLPSEEGRHFVEEGLREIFTTPYIVEDHVAGIRPAVAGRRPLIGRHPDRPELVLFNGWGAKGASLTPYWAERLADHLLEGKELDAAVNIGGRWRSA